MIQNTVLTALETVKEKLEQRDEAVLARKKIFSHADKKDQSPAKPEEGKVEAGQTDAPNAVVDLPLDQFKKVTFELLDIGVFYGEQGVEKVKSHALYQKVDAVINFDDKFAFVKEHGSSLYTILDEKVRPLVQNVFFLYDKATNTVTSYINVITTKQNEIKDYVEKTYSTASVILEGTWMRLDFDNDGSVSQEDLKASMVGFYEFLKNFDVIETSHQVKGKLYTDAIAYMQKELEEDKKKKEKAQEEKSKTE